MALKELAYWYQKKIGTYDKQQWEKTVEQHILSGFTHLPMRTAKLKTEFIDVDLVRGSSFPKAKPKHGLTMVTCLAVQRLLFLPLYWNWWIQQTSTRIFSLFLLLYSLQLINMCLYYFHSGKDNESDIVSTSEVLIPVIMMLTLCIVHSQIVSTHSGPTTATEQKKQRTFRRSRNPRSRSGQIRMRQGLRVHKDSKSFQDSPSERANTGSGETLTSVKFAKEDIIENCLTVTEAEEALSVQRFFDKETMNSGPCKIPAVSEASTSQDQSDNVAEISVKSVHQDDDGFESLNGNVSSDNDKCIGRSIGSEKSKKRNVLNPSGNTGTHWLESSTSQQTLHHKYSAPESMLKKEVNFLDSEDDASNKAERNELAGPTERRRRQCESEEEGECEETATNHATEATTSATEWMGVTTNTDDCSYSSEFDESDIHNESNINPGEFLEHPFSWEFELPPSIMLSSSATSYDRVSCTIWTRRDIKKAELSVLDISSAIIARVESMPESMNYFYGGLLLSAVVSLIPSIKRLSDHFGLDSNNNVIGALMPTELSYINIDTYGNVLCKLIELAFGSTVWERLLVLISAFQRLILSFLLFFLLAVAERTYKQRLLYAKLFSHLTSSRRARKSDLPHFRLNKVRNIKTWLSIRSYLKRRGPQRSVDVIVSAVFIVTLLLLSFVSLELIKDLGSLHFRYNVEALFWSFSLGIFILRFMTLGTKINKKYRNLSVLITEQINLYLQIEQKPHKKEELMVANSVLKLAADLIKELESPFKISGLSANPYLYTITKVVLLSALSGVLSELLGFKLKLHKIKIK